MALVAPKGIAGIPPRRIRCVRAACPRRNEAARHLPCLALSRSPAQGAKGKPSGLYPSALCESKLSGPPLPGPLALAVRTPELTALAAPLALITRVSGKGCEAWRAWRELLGRGRGTRPRARPSGELDHQERPLATGHVDNSPPGLQGPCQKKNRPPFGGRFSAIELLRTSLLDRPSRRLGLQTGVASRRA